MTGQTLASRLRDRVTIQEKDLVANARGGRKPRAADELWKDVAPGIHAEVLPLRGGEALTLGVTRSTQLYRVTIRPRRGILTSMRVLWDDPMIGLVTMQIKTAVPNEKRDGLVMTCESGVPA